MTSSGAYAVNPGLSAHPRLGGFSSSTDFSIGVLLRDESDVIEDRESAVSTRAVIAEAWDDRRYTWNEFVQRQHKASKEKRTLPQEHHAPHRALWLSFQNKVNKHCPSRKKSVEFE